MAVQSNYDKQVSVAREIFLKYDQRDMIEKYDLECDEYYLYLIFICDKYRISRETGAVEVSLAGTQPFAACSDYNVVMSLYDVLCYAKDTPKLAGEWCPLYNLQATMSSLNANIFNQKYADLFAGNVERLRQAVEELGGTPVQISAGADVCCQFDVFPFLPLQFRFWDADDEFPAQIRLLWDRNSLAFMRFETLYYVMGHLMSKLAGAFPE